MPHRLSRTILWTGMAIFVLAWLPLLSALTGWAGDNPVGLGLIAFGGTGLGLALVALGLLVRLFES